MAYIVDVIRPSAKFFPFVISLTTGGQPLDRCT